MEETTKDSTCRSPRVPSAIGPGYGRVRRSDAKIVSRERSVKPTGDPGIATVADGVAGDGSRKGYLLGQCRALDSWWVVIRWCVRENRRVLLVCVERLVLYSILLAPLNTHLP